MLLLQLLTIFLLLLFAEMLQYSSMPWVQQLCYQQTYFKAEVTIVELSIFVSVVPNTFNCSNIGNNNVVLTVNDGHGNTATCNAVVTVSDNTPPLLTCKNISVNLNGSGSASIVPTDVFQSGSDNCGTVTWSLLFRIVSPVQTLGPITLHSL